MAETDGMAKRSVERPVEERAELASTSPDQTQEIGMALASVLVPGDVVILTGDLGAGKTCLTQGLGRGLDITDRITSPTFTLARRYQGRHLLHHLDVYRLGSSAEALDLDLADLFETGITIIEWGERIADVLPAEHLLISIEFPDLEAADASGIDIAEADNGRAIVLAGNGQRWSGGWPDLVKAVATWEVSS